VITVSDMLLLVVEFTCLEDCDTDLDFDGSSGVSDLLILLTIFGSNCN